MGSLISLTRLALILVSIILTQAFCWAATTDSRPATITPAEIVTAVPEDNHELKRRYGYGYGPSPCDGCPVITTPTTVIVVTQTVCTECAVPSTYYTTTTWCPPTSPAYGYNGYSYGYSYGYNGYTGYGHGRKHHKSITTSYITTSSEESTAYCSTLIMQGQGLPTSGIGSCGNILIENRAAMTDLRGFWLFVSLAIGWLAVLLVRFLG